MSVGENQQRASSVAWEPQTEAQPDAGQQHQAEGQVDQQ